MNFVDINDGAREKANEMINRGERNYRFASFVQSNRPNPIGTFFAFLKPLQLGSRERGLRQLRLARPKVK